MSARHVLFLCTGNSARSILAEALLAHHGGERFISSSAGSQPKGVPHPVALETLEHHGLRSTGYRSKSWNEFGDAGATPVDIVITVCDSAAAETCPIWPGHPASVHWGIPDPAAVNSSIDAQRVAFEATYQTLDARIRNLVALPDGQLEAGHVRGALAAIATAVPAS